MEASLCRNSVTSAIKLLEEKSFLTIKKERLKNSRFTCCFYSFPIVSISRDEQSVEQSIDVSNEQSPDAHKPIEPIEPNKPKEKSTKKENENLLIAFNLFNETAEKINIPKAQVLTNERKTKLTARLKDCGGIDGWKTALSILEKSSHCKGKNNRGWKANFDFMLTKSSFVKLMEGNYDSHVPAPAAKHDPSLELAQKMGILP